MRGIAAVIQWLGMLSVAHSLMLIGADAISTLEAGNRVIRSFGQILTLYGADPAPFLIGLPMGLANIAMMVMSSPGWAVFAVLGLILIVIGWRRE